MKRKVQAVRLCLLALAWLVAAWLTPDYALALIPLGYFTGQQSCYCCPGCPGCQSGTADHDQQVVLPSTIINAGCGNCAAYRGTFVLTKQLTDCREANEQPDKCYYRYNDTSPTICSSTAGLCIDMWTIPSGADTQLYVQANRYEGSVYQFSIQWNTTISGEADCSSFSGLTVGFFAHSTPQDCSFSGSPITASVTSL